jgi:hypothetical protein
MVICRDYTARHLKSWKRIYFLHESSRKYLFISFEERIFNEENCKNCSFKGEREVGLTWHKDDQSAWEIVDVIIKLEIIIKIKISKFIK